MSEPTREQVYISELETECERLRLLIPTTAQCMVYQSLLMKHDRLHRILTHIAEHGVSGERMTLIRKWGMSAANLKPEDRVKVLIEEVEKEMEKKL